ncbi:hypothetical protein CCMSSC00406_0007388 [Pleurotus cornucopiae]|uniref:Uncharacterized protein n=1 Tax=Pleurotus cornucopiae TaxID=5321 RepID=A0ACB7IUJ4_PLECO|nr:hypothetical protein CCMSSC00406_0007388 [Pleurotus cornucopiae]
MQPSQRLSRLLLLISLIAPLPCAADGNLTSLANLFIGTASGRNGGSGGNAFPGAAVPHGMAKVGIDVDTAPRQAGYIHDNSSITGISLMHDEGTGGNTNGGYGIFPLFPLANCAFSSCPVGLDARKALRAANVDVASPGYFATQFVNGIKIETTSTRRAGLIRFTYPLAQVNHVVIDLTNDLQRSFEGGSISISPSDQTIKLGGTFLQSYGTDNYTAFACYNFKTSAGASTPFTSFGTFQSTSTSTPANIAVSVNSTSLSFPFTSSVNRVQAGGLVSFNSSTILARFGISFINAEQACANADAEVPTWDWDAVQTSSRNQWEDVLSRVQIDTQVEDVTVTELLYSSLYRASLVPANVTGENPYWDSPFPFYDALFCSWDTFRTVHPLLSLTSPREWSEIVNTYIDGWRHTGFLPECRANTKAGYVQGGSDGMPILGDFAVKYATHAESLGVPTDDLYQALRDTAENTPPDWYRVGRQNTAWKAFGFIPTAWVDPSGSTGLPTREASRAYEYALGDFAVRQAGLALQKPAADITTYANRSMNFVNMWDASLTHDGFTGFAQRRFQVGYPFIFLQTPARPSIRPPTRAPGALTIMLASTNVSPMGLGNRVSHLIHSVVLGNEFLRPALDVYACDANGRPDNVRGPNHYFDKGYFQAGNEPSFEIPWVYHYANRPDLSALRVRQIVYKNFNTGIGGIPGNDDSGAMAALLTFHLLGLYPVPSSKQLLIGSPFLSSFTLSNNVFNTKTHFIVRNFDKTTLTGTPPAGSRIFVKTVRINGKASESLCWINFEDVVGGGEVEIEVDSDASAAAAAGCGPAPNALPDSLETGGFAA